MTSWWNPSTAENDSMSITGHKLSMRTGAERASFLLFRNRRRFPKGTDFKRVPKRQIAELETWMNHYPRKILGWKTPLEAAL